MAAIGAGNMAPFRARPLALKIQDVYRSDFLDINSYFDGIADGAHYAFACMRNIKINAVVKKRPFER